MIAFAKNRQIWELLRIQLKLKDPSKIWKKRIDSKIYQYHFVLFVESSQISAFRTKYVDLKQQNFSHKVWSTYLISAYKNIVELTRDYFVQLP